MAQDIDAPQAVRAGRSAALSRLITDDYGFTDLRLAADLSDLATDYEADRF
jgi:hypothetical protein